MNVPHFTWALNQGKQKQDNRLLPLHIPEPEWLADLTHRTDIVAKFFFDLKNKGKKVSNITKANCLCMKKYYGYF
eukprot:15339398-Ditylum_brightwellii.AAC.1